MRLATDALFHAAPVGWFAPTYKMMIEEWRELRQQLHPIIARSSAQERRIEILGGGTLEMWSLDNPDAGRGRKYGRVILDEAARVPNLHHTWMASVRPTLTDLAGDAWFLSTPKGHNGFWRLHTLALSDDDWAAWQMPTATNPYIDPAEIDAAKRQLPERIYQQEYLAEFIDDAGGVFRGVIDAASAVEQSEPVDGHEYVMGVDWAKYNDFSVLTVLDMTDKALVYMDRFNQIDYSLQVGRLKNLYDRFQPVSIIAERNSMGDPLIEQLQEQGLPVQPFTTTQASKHQAIEALSLALEKQDIAILNDPVLIAELQAYEAQRLPSGMLRYGAPEGMHDDTVMSLALAWQAVVAGVSWLIA